MKILIIDEWIPLPLESGKKIRTFNLIKKLANLHEIVYLAYVNIFTDERKIEVLKENGIRVISINDNRVKKWTIYYYLKIVKNIFSNKPFSTGYHIKKELIDKLIETMPIEKPDLVHCEWTNLAPILEYIKDKPKVIAAHNIESDIWYRLAKATNNPLKKIIARNQATKIEELEKEWYPMVDHCIAVSQKDAEIIKSYGGVATVVDNGVDVQYYSEYINHKKLDFNNKLIYVSSLDTFSNQDAVEYFMKDIFPIITASNPDIEFWIVGKDPPRKISEYGIVDKRIKVTGKVEDVREYIKKSAISIVPLRIGGGSRLKILEAMAMGKPVISTSIGAEGLKVQNEKNILLADTPIEFGAKILELLSNSEKQEKIGKAGFELVKYNYDWETLAKKQDDVWRKVVKKIS